MSPPRAVRQSPLASQSKSLTACLMRTCLTVLCLSLMVRVSSAGFERRDAEGDYFEDEPPPTLPPDFNICDLKGSFPIYCYCNYINPNEATEGNCWIIDDMSNDENQQIWEGLSSQSGIQSLTLHLRSDGILHRIPIIAIQHLPNIKFFEVQYGTISAIMPFNFANSSTLAEISLARNSIDTLEANAFAHLPALTTLNFGENLLTDINRGVFTHLPKLTHLSMDRNNITVIQDRAFIDLHNLIELKLFTNQIKAIVPATFKGLKNLQFLDLHMNRLEVIGDQTFRALRSLTELDLHGNSIKYIAPDSFVGLNKLRSLNLKDNKMLSIGPTVFSETSSIMMLDLRNNVLETLLKESVQPLMENLNSVHMQFAAEGNSFRCDDRLSWMFHLMNTTNSSLVRHSLRDIHCYLEGAALPPRLTTVDTVTYDYVTTPLGIGPKIQLLRLKVSELPDHTRTQIPSTVDPECDPTDNMIDTSSSSSGDGPRGGGGGRPRNGAPRRRNNRGRVKRPNESSTVKEPQSDTSMSASESKSEHNMAQVEMGGNKGRGAAAAEPVHESRASVDNGVRENLPSFLIMSLTCLVAALNHLIH